MLIEFKNIFKKMENFKQFETSSSPSAEDLERIEELERKKQIKRENRLNRIVEDNSELLQSLFSEEADNFEILYEEIQERYDSTFEETVEISPSQSPAYGIFLRLKSNPEKKYEIEHWFRQDLDAKKANFDIMLNQSFADKIKEGVEKLKKHNINYRYAIA